MKPQRIDIHLSDLALLFNPLDPSPVRQRDLAPSAEEFIVGSARELPRADIPALFIHVDHPAPAGADLTAVRDAICDFFGRQAGTVRRRLRQLLRRGRTSLVIGVVFLAALIVAGDLIETATGGQRVGAILRESLLIGGWVAMWRPLEIFLYDWWPLRDEARLYERLAAMAVRVVHAGEAV
jgi:hypothetical protein